MSDAIIVLGRGISDRGVLSPDSIARVEKAVELYSLGVAPRIIMSGSYSFHLLTPPPQTEARAMKEIAIAYGVPSKDLIEETESKDTLGNVYFTKTQLCAPQGWHDLVVIASDDHMPRIQYLFKKIYGPTFTVNFVESKRVLSNEDYYTELQHEKKSLDISKQGFDTVADGDDAAIWNLMHEHHPAYK